MTPEEKRDRRQARHELEQVFRRLVVRRIGLFARPKQIDQAVKIMCDRYYREQIRPTAERIEKLTVAKAQERAERAEAAASTATP